jgi:HAD superfamily hydrolase (TIGR01509 family)
MIKVVAFDCGGVLKTSTNEQVLEDIAGAFEVDVGTLKDAMEEYAPQLQKWQMDEEEFLKKIAEKLGKKVPENYKDLWIRKYRELFKKNDDVYEIIKRLKLKKYILVVASNTIKSHANYSREMGLYEPFDHVILSHLVNMRKPENTFYDFIASAAECSYEECVFIDDNEEYVKAAEDCGMKGIVFKNAKQLEEDLKKLGLEF